MSSSGECFLSDFCLPRIVFFVPALWLLLNFEWDQFFVDQLLTKIVWEGFMNWIVTEDGLGLGLSLFPTTYIYVYTACSQIRMF